LSLPCSVGLTEQAQGAVVASLFDAHRAHARARASVNATGLA